MINLDRFLLAYWKFGFYYITMPMYRLGLYKIGIRSQFITGPLGMNQVLMYLYRRGRINEAGQWITSSTRN